MADLWDDEDLDADNESDLVKQLRAVIKSGREANKAYEQELTSLRPAVRQTSVSSILSGLGVTNPKIAKLIPESVGADQESIKAWVEEYGDVFGAGTTGSAGSEGNANSEPENGNENSGIDSDTAAQWQRIQSQQSQSGVTTPDQETAQLAMLQSAAQAANGNSDLYFAYLRGEMPIPTS